MAKTPYQLMQDEQEIFEGFANKIGLFGGGGGKLVLTNERLLFTNRRKQHIRMEIPLMSMLHIGTASSATVWSAALLITLLVKNAIRVTMKGGQSQRFVVSNKERWVELINEWRTKVDS
jgi:hypothetical protein